jgi:hypothetical protein
VRASGATILCGDAMLLMDAMPKFKYDRTMLWGSFVRLKIMVVYLVDARLVFGMMMMMMMCLGQVEND